MSTDSCIDSKLGMRISPKCAKSKECVQTSSTYIFPFWKRQLIIKARSYLSVKPSIILIIIRISMFSFEIQIEIIYHLFIPKHNISIIQIIIMSGTRAINNPTRYLQLLIILVSDQFESFFIDAEAQVSGNVEKVCKKWVLQTDSLLQIKTCRIQYELAKFLAVTHYFVKID